MSMVARTNLRLPTINRNWQLKLVIEIDNSNLRANNASVVMSEPIEIRPK